MKLYYEDTYVTIYHKSSEDMSEVEDGSVDLVLTDPPYGRNKNEWDVMVPLWVLPQLKAKMKLGGSFYWFGVPPHIYNVYRESTLKFMRELYWWFDTGYPSNFNYREATESILFLVKGENPNYFDANSIRESYIPRPERPQGRPERQNPRGKSGGNVLYYPRVSPNSDSSAISV